MTFEQVFVLPIELYLGFECNFLFCQWPTLGAGYNLGLKHPVNSCKQVAFVAGVQKKPKCCTGLKVAKGPYICFK